MEDNNNYSLDDLKDIADSKGIPVGEYLRKLIFHHTYNSKEVAERLSVKPSRIVALKKSGKLIEEKGLFIKREVEAMRINQKNAKYDLDSEGYSSLPCSFINEVIGEGNSLFISNIRFSDCLTMSKMNIGNSNSDEYVDELESLFETIETFLENGQPIIFVSEEDFRKYSQLNNLISEQLIYYMNFDNMFSGHLGIHYTHLLNRIYISQTELDPRLKGIYESLRVNIFNKCMEEVGEALKSHYKFTKVSYKSQYEMAYDFEAELNLQTFKIRVQKSTGKIFIYQIDKWDLDRTRWIPGYLLPK